MSSAAAGASAHSCKTKNEFGWKQPSFFNNKMTNDLTFSRAYLQGVPEEKKQELLGHIMNQFHCDLIRNAQAGKTSYMVEEHVWRNKCRMVVRHPPPPEFKDWEFIAAIEKRYPDCKVTYEETWVDTGINNRTLKKGVVIDWS